MTTAASVVPDRISRYRLEVEVGSGGAGRVYRAVDEQLKRAVAVKIMLPELAAPGVEWQAWKARMAREARAAAALNHPNVVAIHDVGEADGLPYIVMELVPGRSLLSYLGDSSVPWPRRVRWLADVARALRAAHAAGLVHRDVKPANVLVRDDGVVKVVDFGFAREFESDVAPRRPGSLAPGVTVEGHLVGTPRYVPPEVLREEPLDHRGDQFSWGVVAYELLAGAPPWEADNLALLVAAMQQSDPPLLSTKNPEIPPEVAAVVGRTLARTPADRYPDMNAVVEALSSHAEVRPSLTKEISAVMPTRAGGAGGERAPKPGAPRHGAPKPGAPRHGAPEPGVPQHGAPEPEVPPHGAPEPGVPQRDVPTATMWSRRAAGLPLGLLALTCLGAAALGIAAWLALRYLG